jgi:Cu(I)/Ag(I) efflux system membrane fusion protein
VRKRVFVSRGKGKFEPKEVIIGAEGNDYMFEVIDGLSEGDEIVLSGQFMFDSESRLKEAIAKMLEVRSQAPGGDTDNLDMGDLTMEDDDLNMDDLTMDSDGSAAGKAPDEETKP